MIPGAEYAWSPKFSPDGAWVAFYARADQAIKKVALGGGSPVTIANTPWISWGANLSWSETGHILFADYFGPVRRVSVSGGEPEIVVPRRALRAGEDGTETPLALPGEAGILFRPRGFGARAPAVWAQGERKDLPLPGMRYMSFFGPYLMGWRGSQTANDLVAVPFDRARAEVTGETVALLSEGGVGGGTHRVLLSDTGTLVSRTARVGGQPDRTAWLPLAEGDLPPPVSYRLTWGVTPRVSPDGKSIAWPQGGDVVVTEFGTGLTRVVAARVTSPLAWTPDGRRLIYQFPLDAPGGGGLPFTSLSAASR